MEGDLVLLYLHMAMEEDPICLLPLCHQRGVINGWVLLGLRLSLKRRRLHFMRRCLRFCLVGNREWMRSLEWLFLGFVMWLIQISWNFRGRRQFSLRLGVNGNRYSAFVKSFLSKTRDKNQAKLSNFCPSQSHLFSQPNSPHQTHNPNTSTQQTPYPPPKYQS